MTSSALERPFVTLEEWLAEARRELERVKATNPERALHLAVLCVTLEDEIETRSRGVSSNA